VTRNISVLLQTKDWTIWSHFYIVILYRRDNL